MAKGPFDLHMHESMDFDNGVERHCLRVPGGWIYTLTADEPGDGGVSYHHIFVPWSERAETECVRRDKMLEADRKYK